MLDQPAADQRVRHPPPEVKTTMSAKASVAGHEIRDEFSGAADQNLSGAAVFVDQPTQDVDASRRQPDGARLNMGQPGWTWRLRVQAAVWSNGVVVP